MLQELSPAVTGTLVAGLLLGCGGRATPSAQSPEQQSDAQYDLAQDYFQRGDARTALDHVRKAVELNEENSLALYLASMIHLSFCAGERGEASPDCDLAAAERYARRALEARSGFRDAQNALGVILTHQKKYDEAIKVLEPLAKEPAYASSYLAWGNLGWAQVLSGQVDEGIASLKNAMVTQPKFCVGRYRLGMAYLKKAEQSAGDEKQRILEQAEDSLTNAVSVDAPDCRNLQDAWEARARARMKLGRGADARADLEKCREISAESSTGRACARALGAFNASGGPPP